MSKKLNVTLAKEEILKRGFRDEGVRDNLVLLADAMEKDLEDIKDKYSNIRSNQNNITGLAKKVI